MSLGHRASGTLLATGLAATMGRGTFWSAQAMQATLADQARSTLETRQLAVTVLFAGRDATVWTDTPIGSPGCDRRADATAQGRALNRRVDVTMTQES